MPDANATTQWKNLGSINSNCASKGVFDDFQMNFLGLFFLRFGKFEMGSNYWTSLLNLLFVLPLAVHIKCFDWLQIYAMLYEPSCLNFEILNSKCFSIRWDSKNLNFSGDGFTREIFANKYQHFRNLPNPLQFSANKNHLLTRPISLL